MNMYIIMRDIQQQSHYNVYASQRLTEQCPLTTSQTTAKVIGPPSLGARDDRHKGVSYKEEKLDWENGEETMQHP